MYDIYLKELRNVTIWFCACRYLAPCIRSLSHLWDIEGLPRRNSIEELVHLTTKSRFSRCLPWMCYIRQLSDVLHVTADIQIFFSAFADVSFLIAKAAYGLYNTPVIFELIEAFSRLRVTQDFWQMRNLIISVTERKCGRFPVHHFRHTLVILCGV